MPFRFLHTADLHLDSPIASLALRNGDLADLVRGASRRVFERIVDLAITEEVDALLVAGDLYDGGQTSMATALFLAAQMRRLEAAGIRAFIIRGNHDAQSQITRELTFPPNVHVFDGRGRPVRAGTLGNGREVHMHGISFGQPHAPTSLLPGYKPPVADAVNIGMLHTSLAGSSRHDNYAPAGVADLLAHGFDYWALGHIHQRAVHSQHPPIVMPGIPQGRDINEAGSKSVTLVTVGDDGAFGLEEHFLAVAAFQRLSVDLAGIEDWASMLGAVRTALEQARQEVSADQIVCRVALCGATPLAWRLRRDRDLLAAELQAIAEGVGACWIETVELEVRPAAQAGRQDDLGALAELAAIMEQDVLASHAYRAELRETLSALMSQLPREVRDLLGTDEAEEDALLSEAALRGASEVVPRLDAEREGDRG
ncbi:DNA repair exonuclease SbcCD nuclease subunit [Rhizobium azooxidifex]|uniref:DNA repair exonuclease SbcCD nuclease subunit n=1 Tax=Mycoplana azooxidifex TaxID=1636188 RepID=A0A7W6D7F4_9HYPH|nr:DNA repair exonuclease [Mycoplana azooxidifex]MBB3978128.1 DNA repair exonuclease SbcCD nuclease subunit [Mycoplana azooxidifex]